jgi:dihydroxyacetone kinase-like protein
MTTIVLPRQLINAPDAMVDEVLEGLERAHGALVRHNREPRFVIRAEASTRPKVALVAGGGSGHEPLHSGFVGHGMLDAAVPGAVFTSPTADQILAATRATDRGRGVLHVVKNYTGDVLNFSIAAELAAGHGVALETVLVDDDLATDGHDPDGPGRRGTAAVIAVEKICGAAAENGTHLQEVASLGRRVVDNAATMAVALSGCTHPGTQRASFELAPHEVELGVGIHGERGRERRPMAPAAELVAALVDPIVEALALSSDAPVIAIVNGLGSTPAIQLSIVYREVSRLLQSLGVTVARSLVGSYVTSLDMAGCSVTLIRADDELLELWDAPVHTPALRWRA